MYEILFSVLQQTVKLSFKGIRKKYSQGKMIVPKYI